MITLSKDPDEPRFIYEVAVPVGDSDVCLYDDPCVALKALIEYYDGLDCGANIALNVQRIHCKNVRWICMEHQGIGEMRDDRPFCAECEERYGDGFGDQCDHYCQFAITYDDVKE